MINLHSHLEGRVRPSTAAELAVLAGIPEPAGGWARALQLPGPGDLTSYLTVVSSTYPFFGRPGWVSRIVREAVEDAAADGLDYLELRFGPVTHVSDSCTLDRVIAAACAGLTEGEQDTGMPAGLVIAALRKHDEDTNVLLAQAASRFAGQGVVGFDLAGDELRWPALEPHAAAFGVARAAGLGLTCHAAEAAGGAYARQAVELLGVTRIGHGAHIVADAEVLSWAADCGVVVEVCPTSNWFTGAIDQLSGHPAPVLRDAGVRLVLGDDNPVQTGSALPSEREILIRELGFTQTELDVLDQVSLEAAFLAPGQRELIDWPAGAAQGQGRTP